MNTNDIKINKYNKRFFTKEEMKFVLEQRGLIVDCPDIFCDVNYAFIIYEFSDYFYYSPLKYERGTKLSDIYKLHLFNKEASLFLFSLIHDIEHKLKNSIILSMSSKNAYDYLKRESYTYNKDDKEFNNFLNKLKSAHKLHLIQSKALSRNKMIGGVSPIWIFVNSLTLGQLIKFIKYKSDIKANDVYSKLNCNWKELGTINKFRNQISHMNPIKEKLYFKTRRGTGTVTYKQLVNGVSKIIPDVTKKLHKFWTKNKRKLPKAIRKNIFSKYIDLN